MTTFEEPMTRQEKGSGSRPTVFSNSRWEPQMGYARGVRVGNQIFIAGTVAADGDGNPQGADAYSQSDFIIRKIRSALRSLGADLEDVVSTQTHLADFAHFDDYARAHKKYFDATPPVNTTVQATLVRPELLVEITATAIVPEA